jgi:hypothetical protein
MQCPFLIGQPMKTLSPTPYPELNTVLKALVAGMQTILKNNFVGAYLQGSFAIGDFDEYSDVDFIIVTETGLAEDEVMALQELHGRIFDLDIIWAKHLEGSYFPKAVLRQHTDCSYPLWYLDNGSCSLIQSTHCNTILVRWVVREMGVPLAGLSPFDLVAPIPVQALRQEIVDVIQDWGSEILAEPDQYANHFYQLFILHNYCRMLHDLVRGYPGSKSAGTEWAKVTLDPKWHGLIDRSWATRGNAYVTARQVANADDYQATLEFVRYIIQKVDDYRHLL